MSRRYQCINCDRFIPLRLSSLKQFEYDVYKDNNSGDYGQKDPYDSVFNQLKIMQPYPDSFVNLAKIRYNQISYQNVLRSTFFPNEYKTLNFFPPKKRAQINPYIIQKQSWPVMARNKPLIGRPINIYDIPQIGSATMQMFDWSSTNWVSIVFQGEAHMCYFEPEKLSRRIVTSTNRRVDSFIKWNDRGDKLAMGLRNSRIGIWDFRANKIIYERPSCHPIICLKWSGYYLITVCKLGALYLRSDSLVVINALKLKREDIGNVEISCNKNYIVTVGGISRNLRIWKLPKLSPYCQIRTDSFVRGVAWHPWKETLLMVGNKKLSLWNIEKNQKECEESGQIDDYYEDRLIDSLTFNPKSAELIMNCRILKRDNTTEKSCICVLSNINLIIEELYLHVGGILYLLWSPDSTMLASAGADENIFIWEFFNWKKPYNTNDQNCNVKGISRAVF